MRSSPRQTGFTIVEIAIVLLVVGLMIGGLVAPLTSQLEQRRVTETQRVMDEAREALFGFALRNGYLPCPAISAIDGREDRSGSVCNKRFGYLPWATLGVARLDGWGRVLAYSLTPAFGLDGQIIPASDANDIPAVILSFGRNGYGATSDQNTRLLDAGIDNVDEKTNLNSEGVAFVTRPASTDPRAPGGEYDDLVLWISPNILFNRMVAAQKLP
jgi:type II secretory pathway pseudopilin PulG